MGSAVDHSDPVYRISSPQPRLGSFTNKTSRESPKVLCFKNEEDGQGEVTSFGALCTALSATIGTGNITGVATALAAGGPGALFWMVIAAVFRNGYKIMPKVFWRIKYRTIDKDGHVLGGPFYLY